MTLRHIDTRPTGTGCRAETRLDVWEAGTGKRFFVLAQRGRFEDLCHDHGLMLAKEIEEGVFPEILATIAHDVDASRDLGAGVGDRVQGAFFNRLSKDVLRSCSDEFRRGVEALDRGYFSGLPDPLFDSMAVEHACVAIDTGNIATGFERIRNHRRLSSRYAYWRDYVVSAWVRTAWGRPYAETAATIPEDDQALSDFLDGRGPGRRRAGMGCTGFWAGPGLTRDGRGLHARNFDGAFFDWNVHPVLSLVDETPSNAGYQRYAAVGTAGLIYPGGISGLNEAGIAVSLHQMSTVNFTEGDGTGGHDVAPFVQQRILREARTLDEAVDIVRTRKHFASWTILVSHAPSGKALRIELTGGETETGAHVARVERSAPVERMVQANHFLSPDLEETHRFFEDAHFTKTVGKWTETRARMATATARLDQAIGTGELDTRRALDILADHSDAELGGAHRSFGRTICKSYSLMSSIARASADRGAPEDEIWFTLGDGPAGTPGPHSTLAGFRIDWTNRSVAPAGTHSAQTASDAQLAAMRHYVQAFRLYERPRRADGTLYRRKPTEAEMQDVRMRALDHLDDAVAAGETAGLPDPVFRYIRARLCHEAALAPAPPVHGDRSSLLSRAAADWTRLRELARGTAVPMSDWDRALIHLHAAATEAAREDEAEMDWDALVETGLGHLERVARDQFGSGRLHQDIKSWRKIAASIRADATDAALPEIDFVTVE